MNPSHPATLQLKELEKTMYTKSQVDAITKHFAHKEPLNLQELKDAEDFLAALYIQMRALVTAISGKGSLTDADIISRNASFNLYRLSAMIEDISSKARITAEVARLNHN